MNTDKSKDDLRKTTDIKNKQDDIKPQTSRSSGSSKSAPKYALLDSLEARFDLLKEENRKKVEAKRSRMEMELVHSRYLRRYVADTSELEEAGAIADLWAHKHGTVERVMNKQARKKRRTNCSNNALDSPFPSPNRNRSTVPSPGPSVRLPASPQSPIIISDTSLEAAEAEGDWLTGNAPHFECPVRNCGCVLSCREELKYHLSAASHSPCNPCRFMPEGKIPPFPLCYMCPFCEDPSKMRVDCAEHMVMSDHLAIFSPIAVIAFICPECLSFFPDCVECHKHIQDLDHKVTAVPFAEDMSNSHPWEERVIPTVPVGQELARDFVARCAAVPVTLTCDTCEHQLTGPAEVAKHLEETFGCHKISAQAPRSLIDILLEYIASGRMCTECSQILQNGAEITQGLHNCAPGKYGLVDDLQCSTFHEFIRGCSFHFSERKDQGTLGKEDTSAAGEFGNFSRTRHLVQAGASQRESSADSFSFSEEVGAGGAARLLSHRNRVFSHSEPARDFQPEFSTPGACSPSGWSDTEVVDSTQAVQVGGETSATTTGRLLPSGTSTCPESASVPSKTHTALLQHSQLDDPCASTAAGAKCAGASALQKRMALQDKFQDSGTYEVNITHHESSATDASRPISPLGKCEQVQVAVNRPSAPQESEALASQSVIRTSPAPCRTLQQTKPEARQSQAFKDSSSSKMAGQAMRSSVSRQFPPLGLGTTPASSWSLNTVSAKKRFNTVRSAGNRAHTKSPVGAKALSPKRSVGRTVAAKSPYCSPVGDSPHASNVRQRHCAQIYRNDPSGSHTTTVFPNNIHAANTSKGQEEQIVCSSNPQTEHAAVDSTKNMDSALQQSKQESVAAEERAQFTAALIPESRSIGIKTAAVSGPAPAQAKRQSAARALQGSPRRELRSPRGARGSGRAARGRRHRRLSSWSENFFSMGVPYTVNTPLDDSGMAEPEKRILPAISQQEAIPALTPPLSAPDSQVASGTHQASAEVTSSPLPVLYLPLPSRKPRGFYSPYVLKKHLENRADSPCEKRKSPSANAIPVKDFIRMNFSQTQNHAPLRFEEPHNGKIRDWVSLKKLTKGLDKRNVGTKLLKRKLSYLLPTDASQRRFPPLKAESSPGDAVHAKRLRRMEAPSKSPSKGSLHATAPLLPRSESCSNVKSPDKRGKGTSDKTEMPASKSLKPAESAGPAEPPCQTHLALNAQTVRTPLLKPCFLKLKNCEKGRAYLLASEEKFNLSLQRLKERASVTLQENAHQGSSQLGRDHQSEGDCAGLRLSPEGCDSEAETSRQSNVPPLSRGRNSTKDLSTPHLDTSELAQAQTLCVPREETQMKIVVKTPPVVSSTQKDGSLETPSHSRSGQDLRLDAVPQTPHSSGMNINHSQVLGRRNEEGMEVNASSSAATEGISDQSEHRFPPGASGLNQMETSSLPPGPDQRRPLDHNLFWPPRKPGPQFPITGATDATSASRASQPLPPTTNGPPLSQDSLPFQMWYSQLDVISAAMQGMTSSDAPQASSTDGNSEVIVVSDDSDVNMESPGKISGAVSSQAPVKVKSKRKKHVLGSIVKRVTMGACLSRQQRKLQQQLSMQLEMMGLLYEPSITFLDKMNHIIFLDLENWQKFFQKLSWPLPELTFVWAFKSYKTSWKIPNESCEPFQDIRDRECFCLNAKVEGKNSADFAIFFMVGKMDTELPKSIPFSVISHDQCFKNIPRLLAASQRRVQVVEPNKEYDVSPQQFYEKISKFGRNCDPMRANSHDLIQVDETM